jgi:hypothetical protein
MAIYIDDSDYRPITKKTLKKVVKFLKIQKVWHGQKSDNLNFSHFRYVATDYF